MAIYYIWLYPFEAKNGVWVLYVNNIRPMYNFLLQNVHHTKYEILMFTLSIGLNTPICDYGLSMKLTEKQIYKKDL